MSLVQQSVKIRSFSLPYETWSGWIELLQLVQYAQQSQKMQATLPSPTLELYDWGFETHELMQ